MRSKSLRWAECLIIFAGVPAVLAAQLVSVTLVTIPLLLVMLPAGVWLLKNYGLSAEVWWVANRQRERHQLGHVLWRFVVSAALLLLIAWWGIPEHLFDLPRQRPGFWLLFLLVYPLLSVYPQELLYRAFFFRRYVSIVPNMTILILLNSLLFSWMHIVFHSPVALLYTFVGSLYFSHTYHKSGSLRLVCLEHYLYGSWLFTIGYGRDLLTDSMVQYLGI